MLPLYPVLLPDWAELSSLVVAEAAVKVKRNRSAVTANFFIRTIFVRITDASYENKLSVCKKYSELFVGSGTWGY